MSKLKKPLNARLARAVGGTLKAILHESKGQRRRHPAAVSLESLEDRTLFGGGGWSWYWPLPLSGCNQTCPCPTPNINAPTGGPSGGGSGPGPSGAGNPNSGPNLSWNQVTYNGPATATSTSGGSVAGMLDESFIQQGQQGTPISQESPTYFVHTASAASVYPIASDTVYGNTDGTDPRTTNYSYTWQGTSNLLQSETVSSPPIVAAQNGPATSNTDTADADTNISVFDSYGNVGWSKDGGGFIDYSQFDPLTNALIKQIIDVNTSDTADFSNKPSGWTTPTGGGLELISSYSVDALPESPASAENSILVPTGYVLVVQHPANQQKYNVYASTARDAEVLQTNTPYYGYLNWQAPDTLASTGATPTLSGVGDGNLTRTAQHVDPNASDDRVTEMLYDFRDRPIATKQGEQATESDGAGRLITYHQLDNLGEQIGTLTYAADGVSLSDFSNWSLSGTDPSNLRAYTANLYDDLGRGYQTQQFSVDPSSGAIGSNLVTNYVYDHRSNLIATFMPGGQVTKETYDGAGRNIKDSTTDGGVLNGSAQPGSTGAWSAAMTTANDVVIEQTLNTYDGDSNLTESIDRQRFHNDPTTAVGDLAGPSGGNLASRDYYNGNYFDAADRQTDSVNVGTNGGTAWTRPSSAPADSDTVLVNHTDYNAAGLVGDTVDPRGIEAGNSYDLMARTIQTIAAWDGTQNPTPTNSTNQVTNYTRDARGDVLTMTAVQPSGGATPNQTTAYVYGVVGTIGTNLFSNDLVAQIDYPDKSTGNAATVPSEQQSFGYNFQDDRTSFTDQNGTTHNYNFDVLGRLTADIVATLGFGVDGSILRLGYSFDDAGLPYQQTSYSDTGGSSVVNQVQDAYNGYGQLVTQYQEHSGAVNTGGSLNVQYVYSQPTGANYSRLSAMIYPNGRQLDYVYNSGLDTTISRVSGMSDDSGSGAGNDQSYTYLGLNTIVQALDGNGIELTYIKQSGESNGDAGDQYTGLDRFGRVVDQRWIPVSNSNSPTDRFQYGYDRDGNVLYKNNVVNSSFSELYHANGVASNDSYDPLNRIASFSRGTLSASGNNGTTLDTVSTLNSDSDSSQSFTLDALGNQTSVTTDGTPTGRTVNGQNQVTALGSTGLAYDNNGNTTANENGYTLVYDAWNRLVAVKNGSTTIASYKYDAAGNRLQQTESSATTDLYFSSAGQVLEERQGSTVTAQNVWGLMYVNDLVLRDDNSTSGNLGISGSGLGRRLFVQQDANWNVTALVSTSGTVLERFVYTPYGIKTTLTSAWGVTTDAYGFVTAFQGGRQDPVTGLVHFAEGGGDAGRDVDVYLGTCIEQDPTATAYPDGMNLYQLEGDDPVDRLDPTGQAFGGRVGGGKQPTRGSTPPTPPASRSDGGGLGGAMLWIVHGRYNPASFCYHMVGGAVANAGAQGGATLVQGSLWLCGHFDPDCKKINAWKDVQHGFNEYYKFEWKNFVHGSE